jgi:hypothetical protein
MSDKLAAKRVIEIFSLSIFAAPPLDVRKACGLPGQALIFLWGYAPESLGA